MTLVNGGPFVARIVAGVRQRTSAKLGFISTVCTMDVLLDHFLVSAINSPDTMGSLLLTSLP